MKKTTNIALVLLLNTTLLMADSNTTDVNASYDEDEVEEERNFGFSANLGTWFVGWNQTSTASNMLKNSADALDVKYDIKNSMATAINFHVNYDLISGNMEYYNDMNPETDEKTTGATLGLSALDFINNLSTEVRIVKAEFDGHFVGTDKGEFAKATFNTDLDILDFILYPYNHYVGVGYRSYKYELPQDFYLLRNSDNTLLSKGGIDNMSYKGHFYTLVVDNQRLVSTEDEYQGIVYSGMVGIGKLTPHADGYDSVIQQYGEIFSDSDAKFIDASIGYTYNKLGGNNYNLGITAGYRYNQIETTFNKSSGDYSLITEFKTKFYGPFIKLVYAY